MEELLLQYGTELLGWLRDAASFTKDQLPIFAEEILAFGTAKNTIFIWLYGIVAGVLIGTIILEAVALVNDRDLSEGAFYIFQIPFFVVTCAAIVHHTIQLYMIKTAPRLYLIQEVADLIGGK